MGLEAGIDLGPAREEEVWSGGVHVTLECSRDAAWELFSDFGGLCKWNPAVTVCDLVEGKYNELESVRYCRGTLPDSWVHERLLVRDNENYLMKYRMEENRFRFPEGVQGYVSQIQFHAEGESSTSVAWTYTVQPVATQTYEKFTNFMTTFYLYNLRVLLSAANELTSSSSNTLSCNRECNIQRTTDHKSCSDSVKTFTT